MLKPKKIEPQPDKKPLLDRVAELEQECETFVDTRAAEEAKANPGVPAPVVRQMLMARGGGNVFRAAKLILERDNA